MSKPSLDQTRGGKAPSVTELVAETRIDKRTPPPALRKVARGPAKQPILTRALIWKF